MEKVLRRLAGEEIEPGELVRFLEPRLAPEVSGIYSSGVVADDGYICKHYIPLLSDACCHLTTYLCLFMDLNSQMLRHYEQPASFALTASHQLLLIVPVPEVHYGFGTRNLSSSSPFFYPPKT